MENIQGGLPYMYKCAHVWQNTLQFHAVIPPQDPYDGVFEKLLSGTFFLMLICVPWLIQYGLRSSGISRITSIEEGERGLLEEIHTEINPSRQISPITFENAPKYKEDLRWVAPFVAFD